ncbi:phosphoethanolamine transferase [Serratia nevei]|uniref:phosphoethanolamine transferase n=1 Tax=Serratia nevei TaxID=2703794 RepID=UPI00209EE11B|nr:phosphoethanolamine transferase [Serratia nevei]MCP1105230.1 phosphoethanolamine transferase [Serratia nevei]
MNTHTVILDKLRHSVTHPLLRTFLFYFITALILIKAMGYGGGKGIDILFIALTLLLLSAHSLTRYGLIIPFILLCALYAPVGAIYGSPSVAVVSALLQTNRAEASEFLHALPASCYLLPTVIFIMLIILKRFIWQKALPQKAILSLLALFAVIVITRIFSGSLVKLKLPDFFLSTYSAYHQYHRQIDELNTGVSAPGAWSVTAGAPKNEYYVIIVGESMRRDHMSLFGYPIPTTPFLDRAKGRFYSNYISTAPNTFESLPRTLALSNGRNIALGDNIITLAKAAGLKTHWLSNQGMLGQFDTPVSKIAMFSDSHYFLKKGDFQSRSTNDDALLPIFHQLLSHQKQGNLYVLHLMGSHADFCERLGDEPPSVESSNKELACYLSTYRKTDHFIEQVYHSLKQTGAPFKLFYFSDHGLSHKDIGGTRSLRHGSDTRQNYQVPLLVLSDRDQQHQVIDAPLSAFDFIGLFAQATGIRVAHPEVMPTTRMANADKRWVFDGQRMVDFDQLADDPPELP